ncbi:MAG: ferrochelatase [Ignavibacteriaceae bacterium]|nr:ferrochelatase [Ignavibacteriaceae bacterium]
MEKIAVVIMNLGGPDSLDAVQPFLNNLFMDPDIFKLPFQKAFAGFISKRRAPKVQEEYKLIGGKSPLNEWTELQRSKLEKKLREKYPGLDVITAMRYWHPLTDAAAETVRKGNYDKVILLPLYPHYSISTVGSSINEWNRVYKGDKSKVVAVNCYYEHELYVRAISERIDDTIKRFPEEKQKDINLLFSAHGTPMYMVKNGDPYSHEIKATVDAVMALRKNDLPHHISYQSKVGPIKWLEPGTDTKIEELAAKGVKNLLVIPVSFVSDHIETSCELDIEYRHVAEHAGYDNYIVMEGLNGQETFIEALADITINTINENDTCKICLSIRGNESSHCRRRN